MATVRFMTKEENDAYWAARPGEEQRFRTERQQRLAFITDTIDALPDEELRRLHMLWCGSVELQI